MKTIAIKTSHPSEFLRFCFFEAYAASQWNSKTVTFKHGLDNTFTCEFQGKDGQLVWRVQSDGLQLIVESDEKTVQFRKGFKIVMKYGRLELS